MHTAFRRFFGVEHEPLTFCVHPSRAYRTEIEAWSRHPLAELERLAGERLAALIRTEGPDAARLQPFVFARSREAPFGLPPVGVSLAFSLRCAPLVTSRAQEEVGRRATTREADAFAAERKSLIARVDAETMSPLDRQALLHECRAVCYRRWLERRLRLALTWNPWRSIASGSVFTVPSAGLTALRRHWRFPGGRSFGYPPGRRWSGLTA